jgi:hypothetical protein
MHRWNQRHLACRIRPGVAHIICTICISKEVKNAQTTTHNDGRACTKRLRCAAEKMHMCAPSNVSPAPAQLLPRSAPAAGVDQARGDGDAQEDEGEKNGEDADQRQRVLRANKKWRRGGGGGGERGGTRARAPPVGSSSPAAGGAKRARRRTLKGLSPLRSRSEVQYLRSEQRAGGRVSAGRTGGARSTSGLAQPGAHSSGSVSLVSAFFSRLSARGGGRRGLRARRRARAAAAAATGAGAARRPPSPPNTRATASSARPVLSCPKGDGLTGARGRAEGARWVRRADWPAAWAKTCEAVAEAILGGLNPLLDYSIAI